MRRVVITGMGIVSPLGIGVEHCWNRLIQSNSGLTNTTICDVSDLSSKVAGQVPRTTDQGAKAKGLLNYTEWMDPKDQRTTGDFVSLGLIASTMALEDAGWRPESEEDQYRTGVLVGSGVGGLNDIYNTAIDLYTKGPRRVNPFFIPSSLINLASGQISIRHNLKGPNTAVVTACATGSHALGDAARLIKYGDADVMVAGGTETAVCRIGIAGFCAMRALSTNFNDTPERASRPWDQARDGFVIGEGAGILVLEELEHAKKRGAKIYAEIVGYGMAGDAHHISAPDDQGGYRAMRAALKDAKLNPEDVDYINAHGTSTPLGDLNELNMVKRLFEKALGTLSMSSTKSSTGHLLGAAGAVEAIFSVLSIRDQIVPPTLNLENPLPEAEGVDLVPLVAKKRNVDVALSNSFGFGGTNATVIFKKYRG